MAGNNQLGIDADVTAVGGESNREWAQEERTAQVDSLRIEYTRIIDEFCEAHGATAVYEYKFHPSRKWRADVYLEMWGVLLEIDGGTWINGRHTRPQGFEKDCEKQNAAELLGYHVLRFTADMVRDGRMAETLRGLCPF
jgi:very-short-patch-repair endonuclease